MEIISVKAELPTSYMTHFFSSLVSLNFIISLLCSFSQAPHGPRFQSRITLALIFYQIFVKEVHFFVKPLYFLPFCTIIMRNLGFERGGRDIMSTLKLTLLTDLYEMTMMQGYFKNNKNDRVVFDAFYRSNPSDGGLRHLRRTGAGHYLHRGTSVDDEDIAYLRSLKIFDEDFLAYLRDFRFSGDIYAIPEGTVIFPREPLIKVVAPIMEAQLVGDCDLKYCQPSMPYRHQAAGPGAPRVCYAAQGDGRDGIRLRRAQGRTPEPTGPRAAVIGGCKGTSNVLAGQMFDVPVLGHSCSQLDHEFS